jgi:hypothetical protein
MGRGVDRKGVISLASCRGVADSDQHGGLAFELDCAVRCVSTHSLLSFCPVSTQMLLSSCTVSAQLLLSSCPVSAQFLPSLCSVLAQSLLTFLLARLLGQDVVAACAGTGGA